MERNVRNTIPLRMSSIFLMLLIAFHTTPTFGQGGEECEKPAKKAQKYFDEAVTYNFRGNEAYGLLIKAIDTDPTFAAAYAALAYVNAKKLEKTGDVASVGALRELQKAERMMEKYLKLTIENCPEYRNWEAHFLLGEFYFSRKRYDEAVPYLQNYMGNSNPLSNPDLIKADAYLKEIAISNRLAKTAAEVKDSLLHNKVPFNPVKLDAASTLENDEFLPVLSPDNRYLFFTRKEMVDTKSATGPKEMERFTKSDNNYNRTFTRGLPMPSPFNQGSYQGGASISVDNKIIFVTIVALSPQRDGTLFANGDIYYSEFKDTAWTALKSVGENINGTQTWEGQPSISSDNQTLYFASARPTDGVQNYGGMDLYQSKRQSNGSWGDPVNLGPNINTSGNEKTPFMHSDSYTLYFASDKHPGIGGFDIFYSKMNASEEFQAPKNIGYPINTAEDEHSFVVSTDGRFGYFSSNLEGNGLDIYSFEMPEQARPKNVVFVRGQIVSGSEASKDLKITLKNTETQKEVNAVLDEETGEYVGVIAVGKGEDAIITAKKEGYAFSSQYISSTENIVGRPIESKLAIKKIAVGETYKINNVTFATNSYSLEKHVKTILDEFYDFLHTNTKVRVAIQGHTDNVGVPKENLVLSENRAKAVMAYLLEKGIASDRLTAKGFGQNKPVASNENEEGRAQNRRTEFLILSN
jgi:outer membrane protein OmpA-like peptidoglycan-associated protein/tetratricopeptide (TPR) repeat protein